MKRVLLITGIVLIVLVAGAAGALYWFLSGDGIRRTLEQQASAWLGQPVQIGSARAQFFPRIGLQLENVRAGDPARVTLQTVSISASLRPLLSRRIEDADVTLADSRIELPLPFSLPSSEETSEPAPGTGDATESGGVQLVSVRAITLRNITVASRGREVTVSADSSLAGDRLTLQRFTASSGRTSLDGNGVVELEPAVDANLTVNANQIDVDELLALAEAFSPPASNTASSRSASSRAASKAATSKTPAARTAAPPASAAPSDAHIAAKITAKTARAGDIEMTNFSAQVDSRSPRVTMSPVSFNIFGGRYDGEIVATLGDTMSAEIRSRITDLDVAQLAAYGGAANTVSGKLSGTGTFTGRGRDVASALATARGNGSATMTDGAIQRLNLVRTVVLFLGRPAPGSGEGSDRYDRIDLRYSLANGVARADSFALRSPDFDLTGTGTLTLASKAIDGAFTLLLSEKLSSQAGTDLVRFTREGNRVTLPARVSGTLESPRVTIDAKDALKRGIRNEGERRIKGLLEGLLK